MKRDDQVPETLAVSLLMGAAMTASVVQPEVRRTGNMQAAPGTRRHRKERNKKNRIARASRKRNRR